MKKNVFIFGETGRMGQEVKALVDANPALEYVGGYSLQNPNLTPEVKPDIVIDFSLPQTLPTLVQFIQNNPAAVVSGTTGFSPEEFKTFQSMGEHAPVFWSANMSFGVYLMCQLTEMLARYDKFYNFHVEETHHIHKKDKPSGTAIIVENAAKKSTQKLGETISYREGEVFGIHRFIGTNANEKIEIVHEAFNRSLFAQGALEISTWVADQSPGFYGMDDFFKTF